MPRAVHLSIIKRKTKVQSISVIRRAKTKVYVGSRVTHPGIHVKAVTGSCDPLEA